MGASTVLSVLDGAAEPLTPSQISERVLVAPPTMTATLDLLERRGWVRRSPNLDDRRSTLVEITADGRATADRLLPGIREIERLALDALTSDERVQLLDLLRGSWRDWPTSPPSPRSLSTVCGSDQTGSNRRRADSPAKVETAWALCTFCPERLNASRRQKVPAIRRSVRPPLSGRLNVLGWPWSGSMA